MQVRKSKRIMARKTQEEKTNSARLRQQKFRHRNREARHFVNHAIVKAVEQGVNAISDISRTSANSNTQTTITATILQKDWLFLVQVLMIT